MRDRTAFASVLIPILRTPYGASFYGNAAPTWTQGKNEKPAQTTKQARTERSRLIKGLRRHGKDNEAALKLADLLASCCTKHRCLSGACPVCLRAAQRLFVSYSPGIIKRSGYHWHAASVVWRNHRFAEGQLDAASMFESLKERLQATFEKAKIRLALGGFDISLNEHEQAKFTPHWRPHAWVLVATNSTKRLRKELKAAFPASKRVSRPVRIIRYDGSLAGLAYAMKNQFSRRVSLRPKRKAGAERICRNTRNRPLRASQKVELALALHQAGLASRVFEFGFQATTTKGD